MPSIALTRLLWVVLASKLEARLFVRGVRVVEVDDIVLAHLPRGTRVDCHLRTVRANPVHLCIIIACSVGSNTLVVIMTGRRLRGVRGLGVVVQVKTACVWYVEPLAVRDAWRLRGRRSAFMDGKVMVGARAELEISVDGPGREMCVAVN